MKDAERYRVLLEQKRQELSHRVEMLQKDKTRKSAGAPLEMDSKEQAISLQNNEVVDDLENIELEQLNLIDSALSRIKAGQYGNCVECDNEIEVKRLVSVPYALHCMECTN